MAATDETREPPLLSWRGMQLWSVGYRAPAICEMFMGLKAKKLSSLISQQKKKQTKGKRRKQREGESNEVLHSSEEDTDLPPARCSSLELPRHFPSRSSLDDVPHRHSVSIECSGRISNQLRRDSDATASNLKRNLDNLRRNSDASLNHLQRLSFSPSSSSPGGYERVWVLEGALDASGSDYMLPKEMKLGGKRPDASTQLGRQDSSMSANNRSSCSSFSSSSSVASATSAIAKLVHVGRQSSASSESEQHHLISQLLVGNQFLTHLAAAPLPSAAEHMHPSDGLLSDASMRCREAELKDRIIFFL